MHRRAPLNKYNRDDLIPSSTYTGDQVRLLPKQDAPSVLHLLSYLHKTIHAIHYQGLAQPPATSTHSAKQEPCFPSTSTISVSHLHLHPTPFSLTASQLSQYSSSSFRFFSSSVVFSRNGDRGNWRAGALAGQCWIVVCR